MAKYRLANKAVEDLSVIWNYTLETWSEKQADLYYKMLIKSCENISRRPESGRNYKEILENLYGFRTNRHIIFYRIVSREEIEIIRILHESMDLKNRIQE